MQLVAPVRMLAILGSQQFTHLRTQSGVPALVKTDFAAQCLHRILLLVTGGIKPPLDCRSSHGSTIEHDSSGLDTTALQFLIDKGYERTVQNRTSLILGGPGAGKTVFSAIE